MHLNPSLTVLQPSEMYRVKPLAYIGKLDHQLKSFLGLVKVQTQQDIFMLAFLHQIRFAQHFFLAELAVIFLNERS